MAATSSSSAGAPAPSTLPQDLLCAVCFDPKLTAVSLVPCGHTLDEKCASKILSDKKVCPLCDAEIEWSIPCYAVRNLVEQFFEFQEGEEVAPVPHLALPVEEKEEVTAATTPSAPDALFDMAYTYEEGRGVEKNLVEAARLYRLAADQGHAKAQVAIGKMFQTGSGVTRDYALSLQYFEFAA